VWGSDEEIPYCKKKCLKTSMLLFFKERW